MTRVMVAATKRPAPAKPLAVVGHVEVARPVLTHRFVREAMANAMLAATREEESDRVVGTENNKTVELYGWGPNVGQHVDNTGFMYLLPLQLERSVLYVQYQGEIHEQRLAAGEVVRLWDWAVHWTADSAPVVAAFVGSFPVPDDERAVQLLQVALDRLAAGAYYDAPRVGDGYRVPLDDECWATEDFDNRRMMLRVDAQARGIFVIPCSHCPQPAMRVDDHWPYAWANNACRVHREAKEDGNG